MVAGLTVSKIHSSSSVFGDRSTLAQLASSKMSYVAGLHGLLIVLDMCTRILLGIKHLLPFNQLPHGLDFSGPLYELVLQQFSCAAPSVRILDQALSYKVFDVFAPLVTFEARRRVLGDFE